jgi:hypothetical protein
MRTLLSSLLALALLTGCDIVDLPKGEQAGPVPISGVTRRVLLEDCTGHLCPNCPEAAEIAEQLKDVYGDRLVIVAMHMSTTFAAPQAPIGDGIYDDDFRTLAGNQYESMFQVDGLPKGLIDRTPYSNLIPIPRLSWSSAVAQLIDQPANIDLWIDSLSYNSGTNTVTATVYAAILNAIPGPQNLTIYLTESHIIGWQEDNRLPAGQQNIPDYEFNHVLRGALNNPLGETFIPAEAQVGDTLVSTFSYVLPSNVLVPNNCSLVAYVYNTDAGPEQYQVQEAAERKFVP